MSDIIPIWHDHGDHKGSMTYETDEKALALAPHGPPSIVKLCQQHGLKTCVAASTNFSTFIEAYKAFDKAGIQFVFGLDLWVAPAKLAEEEDARRQESKVTIFIRNSQGYKDLIKLYTDLYTNPDRKVTSRFSSKYVYDWEALTRMWTANLSLALPFFDSAIARNRTVHGAQIVPAYPVDPVLFREVAPEHPLADTIDAALDEYNKDGRYVEQKVKTIYYNRRADFDANAVYRTIHAKSSFSKPELDFYCSREFCLESWLELTGTPQVAPQAAGYTVGDEKGNEVTVPAPL